MKIISSELYVKDNKVYHEGNKPKPKDIGAAPETHTHNYASATTPGGSAEHAIKATEDSLGQRIDKYIKGLSVSGRTITYTRGDGTTGTITTQDNNTDTKVTNTLNTTAKAYITGTTDSATNTGTQVFDTNVYLDTTAGMLTATTFKGALQGNATTATSATSASHAAKLTTPRSINGTNFDGTAAITTSHWGTARTLTIGNTGKSVNGSGNVSWSIGEIGAAPTVHNHTSLTGITNLSFAAESSDSASITTTVDGANTYFDFNLSDDPSQNDMWRWRFGAWDTSTSSTKTLNAMTLKAISTTEAKLTVAGEVQATRLKGTLTGDVKGNVTGTVSGNAGSATKLATARSINGTNFDGSTNITTTNWGTARNIQIGNAVKSVNGSGNVTWSLSEIGAAPVANGVQRWNSVIKCATWSRIMYLSRHTTVGHSGIINIQGTRTAVVFNATFIINTSHPSKAYITQINNTNYSNFQIRAVTNNEGDAYIEVYDNANGATNATTQTLNVSYTAISGIGAGTLTKYTAFTDGTTIPTNFVEAHKITTVNGSHYSGNAATATKLQTARTINGTNFDGTSNITTANWGTARNIQIGNTSKSVNGSSNVSWSLSEIGALSLSGGTLTGLLSTPNNQMGIRLGDDALIGDGNVANNMVLQGVQDSTLGGITFGSGKDTNIYRGGANLLKTDDTMNAVGGFQWNGQSLDERYFARRGGIGKTTNWNSIVHPGCYKVDQDSWGNAESTHAPCQGYSYGLLMVYRTNVSNEDRLYQVYMPHRADEPRWYRMCNDGGWQEWKAQDVRDSADRRYYHAGNKPTPSDIGAAVSNHTHSYLPLSGGTVTGSFAVSGAESRFSNGTYTDPWHGVGCSIKASGNVAVGGQIKATSTIIAPTFEGALSGNANTATKLQTARTIALGGILSGSASFDGSGNVTINATANDITTITKSLNVTTSWADTGITGSNLGTGTYAVQMYINDGTNTAQYQEYYSGIMSWYNGGTNSTDADEILLHKAGHASNGRHVYLRTIRTPNSGYLKLQISCTHAFSAASNITFKFKKLI